MLGCLLCCWPDEGTVSQLSKSFLWFLSPNVVNFAREGGSGPCPFSVDSGTCLCGEDSKTWYGGGVFASQAVGNPRDDFRGEETDAEEGSAFVSLSSAGFIPGHPDMGRTTLVALDILF